MGMKSAIREFLIKAADRIDPLRKAATGSSLDPLHGGESAAAASSDAALDVNDPNKVPVGLRYALSAGNPGAWSTDHREEMLHVTEWNYLAIKTMCIQAAGADVVCFNDSMMPEAKRAEVRMIRKEHRVRIIGDSGLRRAYLKGLVATPGDPESKPLPPSHPLCRILKRPNPTQSGAMFRYELFMQLEASGTALVWNVPNKFGLTVERYIIPMALVLPVPPDYRYPRGGYRITGAMSRWIFPVVDQGFVETTGYARVIGATLPAEQVHAIRWPHPIWKDDGYSALAAGSKITDVSDMVSESRYSQLKNMSNPSLVFTVPEGSNFDSDDLDKAADKINAKYGGSNKNRKVMIVTAGSVTKLDATAQELDFGKAFEQYRDACMAMHQTPPLAAGIQQASNNDGLYAPLKQYKTIKVQPSLDMVADEETERLGPQFGAGLSVELIASAIDDESMHEQRLGNDLKAGSLTKKEWRNGRGMEPFGDERDDQTAGTPDGRPNSQAVKPQQPGQTGPGAGSAGGSGGSGDASGGKGKMFDPALKSALQAALREAEQDGEPVQRRILESVIKGL